VQAPSRGIVTAFGQDTGVTVSPERPSQNAEQYWIYSERPDRPTLDATSAQTYGKWQVFASRRLVDQAWDTVANLVQTGKLGLSAKVATAKPNPNSSSGPDPVIIVYAPDWRDVTEVRRILKVLREAGLAQGWVHFKRDRETLAGAYVVCGRQGVSVWNARPGEGDEISTNWVTTKRMVVTDANASEIIAAIERMDAGRS
jgi:hypothetical protein